MIVKRELRLTGLLLPSVVGIVFLGGCSSSDVEPEIGTLRTAPAETSTSQSPIPNLQPVADGPCPYLSADEVSELNGEHVTSVQIDPQTEDPGCFFYSQDGRIQLTTSVFTVSSPDLARELVDESVPPDSTERADLDGGWTGGKTGGATGALLAVSRDDAIIVVQSTQEQSIKVQRLAELVSSRVG